jgi:hypothetical protein
LKALLEGPPEPRITMEILVSKHFVFLRYGSRRLWVFQEIMMEKYKKVTRDFPEWSLLEDLDMLRPDETYTVHGR